MIRTIREHEQINEVVSQWASDKITNLWIMSYPGIGKTTTVKNHCKTVKTAWIQGHTTAMRLYQQVHQLQKEGTTHIILDDVGLVGKDARLNSILKMLLDDKKERFVDYPNTSKLGTTPPKYLVTAKFCVLTNRIRGYLNISHDERALYDRCTTISYEPTAETILDASIRIGILTKNMYEKIYDLGFPALGFMNFRLLKELRRASDNKEDWYGMYKQYLSTVGAV